jgi:dipicolinate synthase subunit A
MNCINYDFAIIGGDMRQIYMVNDLISRNFSVTVYGLTDPLLDLTCHLANTLAEAINSSLTIITPIPLSKDGSNLISLKAPADLTINKLSNLLTPEHKLFGGCLTKELKSYCDTQSISYYDLMEQEEVILYNTIATAEGAIAEAINSSTTNLHGSSCLIIGYGRCARTLADKLKNLCGHIDVAARSPLALAAAYAASLGTINFTELEGKMDHYDYIFNTVPALILTKDLLANTNTNVVIIDIASAPGGVDYPFAKGIHRNCKLCLGLPGKVAPKSSATFLIDHILSNLGKKCNYVSEQ